MDHHIVCRTCEQTFEPGLYPHGCPACHKHGNLARLEVVMDQTAGSFPTGSADRLHGSMWRYRDLLPLIPAEPITLGEGLTPVVSANEIDYFDDIDASVYFKNETVNPTWSYKDRLNALVMSNALAMQQRHFVVSSTGNHGASTAAYARAGGAAQTVVVIPEKTDVPVQRQIRAYGAAVAKTTREGRRQIVRELVDRGWHPTVGINTAHLGDPYVVEGYKTIAFELIEQLDACPDVITAAVGAGDGFFGMWKGFRELYEREIISQTPRMIALQPAERASVTAALERGSNTVKPVEGPAPITTSTSGPSAGDHVLDAIDASGGTAFGIERDAVEAAIRAAGSVGIFPEPASALAIAGVHTGVETGDIDPGDSVVSLVTGAGVKWPSVTRAAVGDVPSIEPTMASLRANLAIDPAAPRSNHST